MAANTNQVQRTPRVVEAQDSVTRPNDTTAYTKADAISDNATTATAAGAFTLNLLTQNGGSARITDVTLHKSVTNVTNATFWLLLFTSLPAVAGWEDNAASAITDAEMLECKGMIPFAAASWAEVGTGDVQTVTLNTPIGIVCNSDSSTIYGILIAGAAYTPAANEVFTVTVHAVQD